MPVDAKSSTATAVRPGIIQPGPASESVAIASMRSYLMNWALSAWIGVSALLFLVSTVRILQIQSITESE